MKRLALLLGGIALAAGAEEPALVDVTSVAPSVIVDARYASADNFVGAAVDGYHSNKCFLYYNCHVIAMVHSSCETGRDPT